MKEPEIITQLRIYAAAAQVELVFNMFDHIQIRGKSLVNYYPLSRRRTAYISGSDKGICDVTPQRAVLLAMSPDLPAGIVTITKKKSRHKGMRKQKLALHAEDPRCKYCQKELTLEEATVDHVIPRAKGGTNHWHNLVLSCHPCNVKKGDKIL